MNITNFRLEESILKNSLDIDSLSVVLGDTTIQVNGKEVQFIKGGKVKTISAESAKLFAETILSLLDRNTVTEDGTVGDLGAVPTGHKRSPYHSLDIHDDGDDGW